MVNTKYAVIRLAAAAVIAQAMLGCPGPSGPPAVSLGTWLFTISETGNPDSHPALILQSGGQTQDPMPMPPQADSSFSGTLTWMQNGSTFVLDQVISVNNEIEYTGTVQSSASMSGTWMRTAGGVDSGTWSAVKL
jgi:hypothetical protein